MACNVIPFNKEPVLPSHRPLTPSEARRVAKYWLSLPLAEGVAYHAALSLEDRIKVAYETTQPAPDGPAEVIRFLDRDEQAMLKALRSINRRGEPFTVQQFLAKRDEYSETASELRAAVASYRSAGRETDDQSQKPRANPKPPKAKRQARERLPSQERN